MPLLDLFADSTGWAAPDGGDVDLLVPTSPSPLSSLLSISPVHRGVAAPSSDDDDADSDVEIASDSDSESQDDCVLILDNESTSSASPGPSQLHQVGHCNTYLS